ncbi:hypothetical protein, partial [Klebsiella aerogenes]|uniref:hypothetical protein n=1 Tax=Klebsiella aerogenes TaxID=548 RepID=UPI001CC42E46
NVVVRSSGTDIGGAGDAGNTAYIQNLVARTTSFVLSYGEVAYLGNNSNNGGCNYKDCGISFDGQDAGYSVQGSISSSTIRNGYYAIYLNGS